MRSHEERGPLRIALGQLNPRVGAFDENERKIVAAVERWRAKGAELLILSQSALVGWASWELIGRPGFFGEQEEGLARLAVLVGEKLSILTGYLDEQSGQWGIALLSGGLVRRLGPVAVADIAGYQLGICTAEFAGRGFAELIEKGAQALVQLGASPFRVGEGARRRARMIEQAGGFQRPLIFVNQVGGNEELIFDGRSLVVDATGQTEVELQEFSEDFQLLELDYQGHIEVLERPQRAPVAKSRAEQAYRALIIGLRDFVHKSGFKRVLIGLSGGIDSALVAAIAAQALGPENVHAVALPSRFSSNHGREDARILAKNFGIQFDEISIEGSYQAALEALNPHFQGRGFDVTEENIQARLRGVYLMALSNKLGGLVLACSNKSELAVGYTTLYGDLCGALMPIGDIGKSLVYEIARLINEEAGRPLIPQRILEKAPSAELRPDQKDQDSLPPYDILDEIVARYIDERQKPREIIAAGFEEDIVWQVVQLIRGSAYKRRQIPPVLQVTGHAFGVEERYKSANPDF